MNQGIIIKTDGQVLDIDIQEDSISQLISTPRPHRIALDTGFVAYIDNESSEKDDNLGASFVMESLGHVLVNSRAFITGDVVILASQGDDEDASLTERQSKIVHILANN